MKINKFEQEVRLEAVKAASKVASEYDGIGNLMIHARWVSYFILTGNQPEVAEVVPGKA